MTKKSIVLIGGGGHCKSCIEVIHSTELYNIVGILDVPEAIGKEVLGIKIIGTDEDIEKCHQRGHSFLITLGQIKNPSLRRKLFDKVKSIGGYVETIVASSAYVSKHAIIGEGTIIMHKAFVNAGVRLGANNIINTGATLEHDVLTGDHNHISTGTYINGDCKVGHGNFIGSGTVMSNGITIGHNLVIGAGSVVVKDLQDEGIYLGNPARKIK